MLQMQKKITGLTSREFYQTILIPEISCRIIAEDQGVSLETAADIMAETYNLGTILNSFDFESDYKE